jgi:hypothetical protein
MAFNDLQALAAATGKDGDSEQLWWIFQSFAQTSDDTGQEGLTVDALEAVYSEASDERDGSANGAAWLLEEDVARLGIELQP